MTSIRNLQGKPKLGNAWTITDTVDDSMVCIITGDRRGEKKTLAMAGVMVDALNRAVSPRGESGRTRSVIHG